MTIHKPVLLKESVAGLNLKEGAVVVDATLGGGGHAREILKIIGKQGKLIAIDQDEEAIEKFSAYGGPAAGWKLKAGNLVLVKGNFANLGNILGGQGIKSVDGVLADLGYSSLQMEDEKYGMSFLKDAELDMRLDKDIKITAKKIINEYCPEDLKRIIKKYGEERFAGNIAKKIIEIRKKSQINTTAELVAVISEAVPERYKHQKIHFATRTFQALRIETNKELENLEKFIPQAIETLGPGGRLAIISFHSLEDRIVKNMFRENARGCICPSDFPQCRCGQEPKIRTITKKPITPTLEEVENNPRSRSAKLRICEKIYNSQR